MSSAHSKPPARSSLPTGWLVQPPNLLPANRHIKIQPVPIAISATLAFIVGAITMNIFFRKNKEVFLEDRIFHGPEPTSSDAARAYGDQQDERLVAYEASEPQHPYMPMGRQPEFNQPDKAMVMLGAVEHNSQPGGSDIESAPDHLAPLNQQYYNPKSYSRYDSDDETLNKEIRNSLLWDNPPLSKIRYWSDNRVKRRHEVAEHAHFADEPDRQSLGLASKTRIGDPY